MSVFQVKSYRKQVETSQPPTATTATSPTPPLSGGSGGGGVEIYPEKNSVERADGLSTFTEKKILHTLTPPPPRPPEGLPSAQARTCGSCARFTPCPEPQAHMGLCSAGKRAHGWLDGNPALPVELQAGHKCAVNDGKGYRAKIGGYSPPLYTQPPQRGRW